MGKDWPVPTPIRHNLWALGSLAKVVPTMVLQNTLVPVLPILSLVPHQCWGSPSLSVILLWLTLSRGWFCLLAKRLTWGQGSRHYCELRAQGQWWELVISA